MPKGTPPKGSDTLALARRLPGPIEVGEAERVQRRRLYGGDAGVEGLQRGQLPGPEGIDQAAGISQPRRAHARRVPRGPRCVAVVVGSVPGMRITELTTPALLVEAQPAGGQPPHHGPSPAGRSVAAARQGAQVHRAGEPPGGGGPHRVHLRNRARNGGDGTSWARRETSCSRTRWPTRTGSGALARAGARITVAVDSEATIDAAARAGVPEVLIDVNVGLPRCGCPPDDAGRLADRARARRPQRARGDGVRGPHRRPRGPGDTDRHAPRLHGSARHGAPARWAAR